MRFELSSLGFGGEKAIAVPCASLQATLTADLNALIGRGLLVPGKRQSFCSSLTLNHNGGSK